MKFIKPDGEVFEFEKDAFRKGEYSVYKRKYVNNQIVCEFYLFGVSKKYEAETICEWLKSNLLVASRQKLS